MYLDIKGTIERCNRQIKEIESELIPMEPMLLIRCQEYVALTSHLELVTNKKRKVLQRQIKEYADVLEYIEPYTKLKETEKRIQDEQHYKEYAETYIETHIGHAYRILSDNGFMLDDVLTEKGNISCMINEIHLLVFSDLYKKTNGFNSYESTHMFALFSCFYDLKNENTSKPDDPNLTYIKERLNYYHDNETKCGLSSMNQSELQYVMYDYIIRWMDHCDDEQSCLQFISEFKSQTNLFVGDFVKCCLKLIHISHEVSSICEYMNDYECLDKIKDGKQKIMKFIMSNQSLYL